MPWRRLPILVLALAWPLSAVPITYGSNLYNGIPVVGTIHQPNGQPSNPIGAVYYWFFADAGSSVTVTGTRLSYHYDMSLWVFSGLYSDTSAFGTNFSTAHPGYITFGDDEIPSPGPYGDPLVTFSAPSTGFYTVAVTNFASSGVPPYEFQVVATGVSAIPEPQTWGLLALGLAALALRRRYR